MKNAMSWELLGFGVGSPLTKKEEKLGQILINQKYKEFYLEELKRLKEEIKGINAELKKLKAKV
jgi:hypothetical protein